MTSDEQAQDSPVGYRAVLRERYLAAQRRYNLSRKGKARYKKYENEHPERAEARWEPARNNLRRSNGNG